MAECIHCNERVPLWRTEYGWLHIVESTPYSRTTFTCWDMIGSEGFVGCNQPWENVPYKNDS